MARTAIIINGRTHHTYSDPISYATVVWLSQDGKTGAIRTDLSVTYTGRDISGSLTPGQAVTAEEGMVFNVGATNQA